MEPCNHNCLGSKGSAPSATPPPCSQCEARSIAVRGCGGALSIVNALREASTPAPLMYSLHDPLFVDESGELRLVTSGVTESGSDTRICSGVGGGEPANMAHHCQCFQPLLKPTVCLDHGTPWTHIDALLRLTGAITTLMRHTSTARLGKRYRHLHRPCHIKYSTSQHPKQASVLQMRAQHYGWLLMLPRHASVVAAISPCHTTHCACNSVKLLQTLHQTLFFVIHEPLAIDAQTGKRMAAGSLFVGDAVPVL